MSLFYLASSCTYTTDFTPCLNNKRNSLLTPKNCSSTSPILITDLDCTFACDKGTYLTIDPTTKFQKCLKCEAGSYSIGGGLYIDSWDLQKNQIFSYCWVLLPTGWKFNHKCTSWHSSQDEYLISGKSSSNNWYETDMIFFPNIVKQGSLHITYRKETLVQPKDDPGEFMIFVDGVLKFIDLSKEKLNWYTITIPLSIGPHEIEFIFNSFVTDKVNEIQIKEIQIRGTFASLSCDICAKGSSSIGSDSCIECGIGSYLQNNTCILCPEGTSSLEGSIGVESCMKLKKCGSEDYHFSYSDCIDNKRMKIFEWNFPLMCNNEGVVLPNPESADCASCPEGMIVGEKGKCEHCKNGYFLVDGGKECIECSSGRFAPKLSFYKDWDEIPKGFKTLCTTGGQYECDYSWEPRTTHIMSSPFYQVDWAVHVQKNANITQNNAYIMFRFELVGNVQLLITIDGVLISTFTNKDSQDQKILLEKGERQIKWTCKHSKSTDEKCLIFEILINGSDEGGAINCIECDNGYYSQGQQDECFACGLGFTHNPDKSSCIQCENNTYSDEPGLCKMCQEPTISDDSHKYCKLPSEFQISDKQFSLQKLIGKNGKSDYCSQPSMELSCHQSFFGPVQSQDEFFYISVGQPSIPELPTFPSASKDFSYIFGVLNKNDLTLEEQQMFKPNNSCSFDYTRIIVNLGSTIKNFEISENGFKLVYTGGDLCTENEAFEAEVEFYCEKSEVEGWPIFVNRTGCKFYFVWPTIHGCSICNEGQVVYKKGSCEDGHRTVHILPNSSCVFEDFSYIKVKKEKCKSGPFYTETIFMVGCVFGVLLLILLAILCYFTIRTKIRYTRLDTFEDSASIGSEDASPRTPDALMKKLKGRFPSFAHDGLK
jgi:hypothetical protein